MSIKRRTYSKEYKEEAVALVIDNNMSIAQAARQLCIGEQMLGRWVAFWRQKDKPKSTEAILVEEKSKNKELEKRVVT
ncbi:MAG: transposase [Candidatus Ancillula sp.]|jgi:transposase|nr:transposase [Candidatus Ancillula sp.]